MASTQFHLTKDSMIDNYNTLKIGQYIQIQRICKDESLDDIERQVKVLSILSGIPEDEILHLPINKYKELVVASRFLESEDKNKHLVAKQYVLGDMVLCPVTDYRKIETCQYVDFQTFAADLEKYMVQLLSVLLIPKGCRYNEGYDILDVQAAINEHLSVTDAITLTAFFFKLCVISTQATLNYCSRMARKVKNRNQAKKLLQRIQEQEAILQGSGDGSQM